MHNQLFLDLGLSIVVRVGEVPLELFPIPGVLAGEIGSRKRHKMCDFREHNSIQKHLLIGPYKGFRFSQGLPVKWSANSFKCRYAAQNVSWFIILWEILWFLGRMRKLKKEREYRSKRGRKNRKNRNLGRKKRKF